MYPWMLNCLCTFLFKVSHRLLCPVWAQQWLSKPLAPDTALWFDSATKALPNWTGTQSVDILDMGNSFNDSKECRSYARTGNRYRGGKVVRHCSKLCAWTSVWPYFYVSCTLSNFILSITKRVINLDGGGMIACKLWNSAHRYTNLPFYAFDLYTGCHESRPFDVTHSAKTSQVLLWKGAQMAGDGAQVAEWLPSIREAMIPSTT